MRKKSWDGVLTALALVRLGQELGTDSALARGVYAIAELAGRLAYFFPVDRF